MYEWHLLGCRGKVEQQSSISRAESAMDFIRAADISAIDNRSPTLSLELKCLETSFGAQKQKFSIPRDSTWPPCYLGLCSLLLEA